MKPVAPTIDADAGWVKVHRRLLESAAWRIISGFLLTASRGGGRMVNEVAKTWFEKPRQHREGRLVHT
jgi:hypothetical protein